MSGTGQQEEVEFALSRWGREATCRQALKSWCKVFLDPSAPGQVCYSETETAWIGVGTPLTSDQGVNQLATRFVIECRRQGKRPAFFGVEPRGRELLHDFSALRMGLQPILELPDWLQNESDSGEVGRQYRRGRRKGVEVEEVGQAQLAEDTAVEELSRNWLKRRRLATIGFMTDPCLLSGDRQAHFFKATSEGRLVGLLRIIPSPRGYLLENIMVDHQAPNGTAEVLIVEAARWADSRGAAEITLGLAPLYHLELEAAGPDDGPWWLRGFLDFCYQRLGFLYNFRGLARFKKKFRPSQWQSVYLVHPPGFASRLTSLLELLRTFAGGSLMEFARRSVLMRLPAESLFWRSCCAFFTITLLPWLLLLYFVPGEPWFGCHWLGRAWALFDLGVAALFTLLGLGLRRGANWVRDLGLFACGVVSADLALTWLQFFLFSWPKGLLWWEWPVVLSALFAPLLALFFLALLVWCRPKKSNI